VLGQSNLGDFGHAVVGVVAVVNVGGQFAILLLLNGVVADVVVVIVGVI
jgi:hypothetical protein